MGWPSREVFAAPTEYKGKIVVMDSQLGQSDLIPTACGFWDMTANADANILVWVAQDVAWHYYQSIVSRLNESDNIAIYAVVLPSISRG